MAELLNCPFCGTPPVTHPSGEGGRGLMIECMTVGCVRPHTSYYDHASAIRKWNTRTPSSDDLETCTRHSCKRKEALRGANAIASPWLGTDVDSLKAIELDATGCMTGLALYIAVPTDGGPSVRQGRYDAACGFVDSTTGRRIDVDAWSYPARAAALRSTSSGDALRAHVYQPDRKYPWFCTLCGYAEHEVLQHSAPVEAS